MSGQEWALRACMLYEYKLGRSPVVCCRNLRKAFGGAVSECICRAWFRRFRYGDESLSNLPSTDSRPLHRSSVSALRDEVIYRKVRLLPIIRTRFPGERVITLFGTPHGLLYRIPGTNLVHAFYLHRKNRKLDIYCCTKCRAVRAFTQIRVIGNEFLSDPCRVLHRCSPRTLAEDKTKRLIYEKMNMVRNDERFAGFTAKEVWLSGLREIIESVPDDDGLKEEMLAEYCAGGFKSKLRGIRRNLQLIRKAAASKSIKTESTPETAAETTNPPLEVELRSKRRRLSGRRKCRSCEENHS